MILTRDEDIAQVLAATRRIALLGASNNPARPSYQVLEYLLEQGYTVFPVNPVLAGETIMDQQVYATLADIHESIDMVDVFRQAHHLPEILDQATALGITVFWTQLGVVNEAVARKAAAAGICVIMDRCPAIEGPRLKSLGFL